LYVTDTIAHSLDRLLKKENGIMEARKYTYLRIEIKEYKDHTSCVKTNIKFSECSETKHE
jgi:hypothetical protein